MPRTLPNDNDTHGYPFLYLRNSNQKLKTFIKVACSTQKCEYPLYIFVLWTLMHIITLIHNICLYNRNNGPKEQEQHHYYYFILDIQRYLTIA